VLDNAYDRKSAASRGKNGTATAVETEGHGNGHGGGKTLPLKGNYGPPEMEAVDIFRLLDQLEELPEKATHLPLNTLVGFDHEQFYYLVLKIRANLPDDMKNAQRVARDSDRIVEEARDAAVQQLDAGRAEANKVLDDARAEAARMIEQARQQAMYMVDHTEVAKMATSQAHEILRRAETESSEIRKGADDYARDVLTNLEGVMSRAIVQVQRGREALEKARG
jgi:vacuolar-type H+-ATPase subunit H